MIELPESITLSQQLNRTLIGKTVVAVQKPTKPHKFCWFNGDPALYEEQIAQQPVCAAQGFGMFVELSFGYGMKLCINDGVNIRYLQDGIPPKDYQLLIRFSDGTALVFTVAMYGGIILHDGSNDNDYYLKSQAAVSPLSDDFPDAYARVLAMSKPSLSVKALLATEQRFPGVGNGVLQDILFAAGLHPKRKLSTLQEAERAHLCTCTVQTLQEMVAGGGRDTEKDLFGNTGGYTTRMSRNALSNGCPVCHAPIVKEQYLGGSVYYCPHCQPLIEPSK